MSENFETKHSSGRTMIWFAFAIDVILLDQISKWAISEYLIRPRTGEVVRPALDLIEWFKQVPNPLPFAQIELLPFFNLVMVWNKGVSFGMFNGGSGMWAELGPQILLLVALAITVLFTWLLIRARSAVHGICYALIIGGAIGNMIDRMRFGAVIDFLDFHVAGYHWPAFNVADSAIFIGIVVLLAHSLLFDKSGKEGYSKASKDHV